LPGDIRRNVDFYMLRKSLFWGLTLVLIVALVNLIIRGRQMEKQQEAKSAQVVQQSKPTPTRVLSPEDLAVNGPAMRPDSQHPVLDKIGICNRGSVSYTNIQLQFLYLDRNGKELATSTHLIQQTVKPGETLEIAGTAGGQMPASTAESKVSILYADIAS
jgi:hypothetical protein